MKTTLILLTLTTIISSVKADFGTAFTTGYIAQDVANKIRKKVQKCKTKNITNNEIRLRNCYTFKKNPSQFTKDIIIPTENYLYEKKFKNPQACVLFTTKSNFTEFRLLCKYKIIDPNDGLAIEFLWNIIIYLSLVHIILVCLCGKQDQREELAGFICGTVCNEFLRSLCEDDD
jgi:hypothetical protein